MNSDLKCIECTGVKARISNLEKENKDQWGSIMKNRDKNDQIYTRVNIILGGIAVSCILLVINILITIPK